MSPSHRTADVSPSYHPLFDVTSQAAELATLSIAYGYGLYYIRSQAGELATLVPLQHGARRVVLVGDPQQLPATVLSLEAKRCRVAGKR